MLKTPRLYHFGDFSLDLDPPTLRKGLEVIKLPQRQMEILCLLIAAGGSPVPKKDFFDHVWRGSFVEEGNLTQTVFLLRRTLGKLPDGGEYIETLQRKGYRLAPAALLSHCRDSATRRQVVTVQTRVLPLQASVSRDSFPELAPAVSLQTLRERLASKLETRWEPVLWIGIGMLVSLFLLLITAISLDYVRSTSGVYTAEDAADTPLVVSVLTL